MPPKKLQPSNLLPPLPEGSTGFSVLVGVGATVGFVGGAAAVVVVVELVVTGVVGLAVVFVVVELEVVEVTVVVDVAVVVLVLVDDELGVGGVVVPGVTVLVLSSVLGHVSSARWTSSRVAFGFKSRIAFSVKLSSTHSASELSNVANLQLSRVRHPAQVSLSSPQETVS